MVFSKDDSAGIVVMISIIKDFNASLTKQLFWINYFSSIPPKKICSDLIHQLERKYSLLYRASVLSTWWLFFILYTGVLIFHNPAPTFLTKLKVDVKSRQPFCYVDNRLSSGEKLVQKEKVFGNEFWLIQQFYIRLLTDGRKHSDNGKIKFS